MASASVITEPFDTLPELMSIEERLSELASIFARGYRRLLLSSQINGEEALALSEALEPECAGTHKEQPS